MKQNVTLSIEKEIIVDMNLPPRWVPLLQSEGLNAVHWSSIGAPGTADSEIMEYAELADTLS